MQKIYLDTGIYPHVFLCNSRGPYSHIPIYINKATHMPSIVYLDDMVLYGKGRYIVKHWPMGLMEAEKSQNLGAWAAQVIISKFVSSSPVLGLEPASDSVSPSLSAPPPFMLCLSLSQK